MPSLQSLSPADCPSDHGPDEQGETDPDKKAKDDIEDHG